MDNVIADIPEVKSYEVTVNKHNVDMSIVLVKNDERERDSFEIEEEISSRLNFLRENGYNVE